MVLLAVILALLLAGSLGIGALAHTQGWTVLGGPSAWGRGAARRFGVVRGTLLVCAAGWVSTLLVGLALGVLARALEKSIDRPIFDWINGRVSNTLFTRLNEKFTQMGNGPIVEVVITVSFILLVCAYKGRRWLPAIAIIGAFTAEKLIQKYLATAIHRGHPPTTLGTYPSGGVGRLLGIYSVVVILAIVLSPSLNRAWRAGLWVGLFTAGVLEAFNRVYLSQHWFTDAAFGLVFGSMLLITNIAAVSALAYRSPDHGRPRERAARELAPAEPATDSAVSSSHA